MATQVRERTVGQETLADFILSFVQALLRTGYYLPDHPQARKAKQGLYGRFRRLFHARHELTFMVQDVDGRKNVLVEGVLAESQPLSALMPAGMAEVYAPRLAHFLERKDLLSVTLKADMGEEEFSRFVDMLSETWNEASDAAGKERVLARLREAGVVHFSVVFAEDLVAPERKLPWRAHLALARLRKDLARVPLFHDLDDPGFRSPRQQVLHDVLRPIHRPDLLAALLMNGDLAASSEVPAEEIEDEIARNVPDALVLPTSGAALATLLSSHDPECTRRQRRALLRLVLAARAEEPRGLPEFVRELFDRGLVELERLPASLKDQILLERDADRFLHARTAMLACLEATTAADAYRLRVRGLVRLVPELLRRDRVDDAVALATMVRGHAALGGPRGPVAAEALLRLASGEVAVALKAKFLHGRKEDRMAVATLCQSIGDETRPLLLQMVREAADAWTRKSAAEVLLHMGPHATEMLVAELHEGWLSAEIRAELLVVLGECRRGTPSLLPTLHEFTRDADPRVREEAMWALCRLRGAAEEPLFLQMLDDPDPEVLARALRCLRAARCGGAIAKVVELLSHMEQAPELEPMEEHMYAVLPDLAAAARARGGPVEELLIRKLNGARTQGLWSALHRPRHPLTEDAFQGICEALAVVGTERGREALAEQSRRVQEPVRHWVLKALRTIESRVPDPQAA
jgi:HEAT repeat protein